MRSNARLVNRRSSRPILAAANKAQYEYLLHIAGDPRVYLPSEASLRRIASLVAEGILVQLPEGTPVQVVATDTARVFDQCNQLVGAFSVTQVRIQGGYVTALLWVATESVWP